MSKRNFALILLAAVIVITSCGGNAAMPGGPSPESSGSAAPALPENSYVAPIESPKPAMPASNPVLSEPIEPLERPENYVNVTRNGGAAHVVDIIAPESYLPIENYPELEPFCAEELAAITEDYPDSYYSVDVAEYDINADGNMDYFIRIEAFYYGRGSPFHMLVFRQADGTQKAIEIGGYSPEIAIMDSTTNGMPDISVQGFDYYPLHIYNGYDQYVFDTPISLFVTNIVTSPDELSIEDGKLFWRLFRFSFGGDPPPPDQLPFYVGVKINALEGVIKDSIMWAYSPEGKLLALNDSGEPQCYFAAEIINMEKAVALFEGLHDEDEGLSNLFFPLEPLFVYVPRDGNTEPDALINLTDKTSATLTISDLKLLLEAPADVINETFNIKRDDINQWMMGNTATAPMKDVELAYGQINGESLPEYLDSVLLRYSGEKSTEIPLGFTIDDILNMQEWGDAPIEEFGYAMGYSGEDATPIKAISYEKDGLSFSFRTDYSNAFLPKEAQDETISLVIIRRLEAE